MKESFSIELVDETGVCRQWCSFKKLKQQSKQINGIGKIRGFLVNKLFQTQVSEPSQDLLKIAEAIQYW